jgi:hypothetical protein
MWIALAVSTAALLAFFYALKFSTQTTVTPSFGWYVFCGVLWGISLIVPGMSSSSLLLFLGLYQPMSAGISALDPGVLVPFAVGIIGTVVLLARLVNRLFERHYGIAFFCVIGFVIASTIPIIPLSFNGTGEALVSLLAAGAGVAASFFLERWGKNNRPRKRRTENGFDLSGRDDEGWRKITPEGRNTGGNRKIKTGRKTIRQLHCKTKGLKNKGYILPADGKRRVCFSDSRLKNARKFRGHGISDFVVL